MIFFIILRKEKTLSNNRVFPLFLFSFISKLEIKKHVRIGKEEKKNDER
jgi:hypothetical protein